MQDDRENQPWDPSYYGTGSTHPPKSHSGLVAVLLVLVIFLGGIASALGLLNIRLFRRLEGQPSGPVSFYPDGDSTPRATEAGINQPDFTLPAPRNDLSLNLQLPPQVVENRPQAGGLSLQEIYGKAIDSVVSISCTLSGSTSSGSGVVIDREGYLITNCHVVDGATSIRVRLTDERVFSALVVGMDRLSDLAVLYIPANDLTPAEFGDSTVIRVGDSVAAIGDPLGESLRGTMTDGIISAINRNVTTGGRTMTLLQTNAALNSGNSGGPLLNCFGQVIGINTMKIGTFVDTAGVEGIGFAIPSVVVKDIVDQLLSQGFVSGRPSLGISGETVSAMYQSYYRLPAGFLLAQVEAGSAAEAAGLAPGDIIIQFEETRIKSSDELISALYAHSAGDSVTITVYRAGRQHAVTVTLQEMGN